MQNKKGFTLVEILIVILVMIVLAAMMTMSTSEAKLSADASDIVNKLRNLKTAAMQMYVQYLDTWEGDVNTAKKSFDIKEVKKFLNNDKGYDNKYVIVTDNTAGSYAKKKWYVAYNLGDKDAKFKKKLAGRTTHDELLGNGSSLSEKGTYPEEISFNESHSAVLLLIKR